MGNFSTHLLGWSATRSKQTRQPLRHAINEILLGKHHMSDILIMFVSNHLDLSLHCARRTSLSLRSPPLVHDPATAAGCQNGLLSRPFKGEPQVRNAGEGQKANGQQKKINDNSVDTHIYTYIYMCVCNHTQSHIYIYMLYYAYRYM